MRSATTVYPRPPKLPFGWHLMIWLGLALLVAAITAAGLWLLAGQPSITTGALDPKDRLELLKVALTTAAGVGGVVALVVAYRKQQYGETEHQRENSKLFQERYTNACDQLGSDKSAVRLGGVYALASLADDWQNGRQTCIDVLCAYLRMPYTPPADSDIAPEDPDARKEWGVRWDAALAERQVRHTIIRTITQHLRADASMSWQGHDFDFTGAVFDGGDFSKAQFAGGAVHFSGARFSGTVFFREVEFSGGTVSFDGTRFAGVVVSFEDSRFSGGEVSFRRARFSSGTVSFREAGFAGGQATFQDTQFSGGAVTFQGAQFTGGAVAFPKAGFSGSEVSFQFASFSEGEVSFDSARFSGGTVTFDSAGFTGGTVDFTHAKFSGSTVTFLGSRFSSGVVSFRHATFADGDVSFLIAGFSGGTVTFNHARYAGGTVSFEGATFSGSAVTFDGVAFGGGRLNLRNSQWRVIPPRFDATVDLDDPPPGLYLDT